MQNLWQDNWVSCFIAEWGLFQSSTHSENSIHEDRIKPFYRRWLTQHFQICLSSRLDEPERKVLFLNITNEYLLSVCQFLHRNCTLLEHKVRLTPLTDEKDKTLQPRNSDFELVQVRKIQEQLTKSIFTFYNWVNLCWRRPFDEDVAIHSKNLRFI